MVPLLVPSNEPERVIDALLDVIISMDNLSFFPKDNLDSGLQALMSISTQYQPGLSEREILT